MSSRLVLSLCGLVALARVGAAAGTTFTPPPGPLASPAQIAAILATIPPRVPGETVVDFEQTAIGEPMPKWEERGVVFTLAGPLQRTPAAKPRVMFFPHLATGHKGILNAMPNDQGVPLKISFSGAGASAVTVVLWGSTGCPAIVQAYDAGGNLLDKKSLDTVPGRNAPGDPVPFVTLTLQGAAIAYVNVSGPRNGEYLAVDEVRFTPRPTK